MTRYELAYLLIFLMIVAIGAGVFLVRRRKAEERRRRHRGWL